MTGIPCNQIIRFSLTDGKLPRLVRINTSHAKHKCYALLFQNAMKFESTRPLKNISPYLDGRNKLRKLTR